MGTVPFKQRFGFETGSAVEEGFPVDARIGLAHILAGMCNSNMCDIVMIMKELYRVARIPHPPDVDYDRPTFEVLYDKIEGMKWNTVYDFCERIYNKALRSVLDYLDGDKITKSLDEVKTYFSEELNQMLEEENVAYQFVDGRFQRRGHAQTQKIFQRMGSVLTRKELVKVRQHYNKALHFFNQKPEPDSENCIKDAICALEACLSQYYEEDFSTNFSRAVNRHRGNGATQIPGPIAESIIRVYGFRGSGQGVAHAAPNGNKVSELEAELILNLVGSYITYISDLLLFEQRSIPF
jgi:hypothetical protein